MNKSPEISVQRFRLIRIVSADVALSRSIGDDLRLSDCRRHAVKYDYTLALTTCPDLDTAKRIASLLIESHVSACVNIVPKIVSVYRWKGTIECEEEYLLLIKTRTERFAALRELILAQHPYELPEVIEVPLVGGFDGYLRWIDAELAG